MKLRKCSAIRCKQQIPSKFLMCRAHWQMVPLHIQDAIWREFKPGQTISTVSNEYLSAMNAAIDAVAEREGIPNWRRKTVSSSETT